MNTPDTQDIQLLSSVHGRDRRLLRHIGKHDLRAAVKYGVKTQGYPHPVTGALRYKYTFANIVYVTDETSTQEITCYTEPVEVPLVELSEIDLDIHERMRARVAEDPSVVTSHTILLVDQSGSMRTCDVDNFKTRSDAAYATIALDFIGSQLDQGDCAYTDVITLVEMSDEAQVVFHMEPITNILYNRVVRRMAEAKPYRAGNYLPALQLVRQLLQQTYRSHSLKCAFLFLFLSDGRPSDPLPWGYRSRDLTSYYFDLTREAVLEPCRVLGDRLTVCMVGFASTRARGDDQFALLRRLARAVDQDTASHGRFELAETRGNQLSCILTTVRDTLTQTRTMLTLGRETRVPRAVVRVKTGADNLLGTGWIEYYTFQRHTLLNGTRQDFPWDKVPPFAPGVKGVAVRTHILGEGAERVVYLLREFNAAREFVGPQLVAKDSRFLDPGQSKMAFHQVFCRTQRRANVLAVKFNDALRLACRRARRPVLAEVRFLECSLYKLGDNAAGEPDTCGYLVEKMLDHSKYTKWNGNAGFVDKNTEFLLELRGAAAHDVSDHDDETDEDSSDSGVDKPVIRRVRFQAEVTIIGEEHLQDSTSALRDDSSVALNLLEVPQAFSHFTARYTKRKRLVCDLQGVLDRSVTPPVFEMTDPVIHSRSTKHKGKYGRTDHGQQGITNFHKTHTCGQVCRLLGLAGRSGAGRRYTGRKNTSKSHM